MSMQLPMGKHPLLRGDKRSLSPKEMAAIIELSTSTVYGLCRKRIIKSYREPGTGIRITRAEAVRIEAIYCPDIEEDDPPCDSTPRRTTSHG